MARKVAGIEPTKRPSRAKTETETETEAEAEAEVDGTEEQPKAKQTFNPKALKNKGSFDRHPVTATIKVYRREGLISYAAGVTADEDVNPDGVNIKLGSICSMMCEIVGDIALGDPAGVEALKMIANAKDPEKALGLMAVQYKLSQKQGEDDEDKDEAASAIDLNVIEQMLGDLMAADNAA